MPHELLLKIHLLARKTRDSFRFESNSRCGSKFNKQFQFLGDAGGVHQMRQLFRLFGFFTDPILERRASSVAIIDAATVYGAGRYYFGDHDDPKWAYASQYDLQEDRTLFHEFLHNVLLYDHIVLDNKSRTVKELKSELLRMFDVVNVAAKEELIKEESIAPTDELEPVIYAVSRLIAEADSNDQNRALRRISSSVPWYYQSSDHYDYARFLRFARQIGMPEDLIPITLFVYRGLCYSGYANHVRKLRNVPTVYLASPGRLQALQPILSREAMEKFHYPRQAYGDLVSQLDLPEKGYDFSHLGLPNLHLSSLETLLASNKAADAFDVVVRLRSSPKGKAIRAAWANRIWQSSSACAVGSVNSNVLSGATIYGNVNQVLYASAQG
jgi:hypothetical protein